MTASKSGSLTKLNAAIDAYSLAYSAKLNQRFNQAGLTELRDRSHLLDSAVHGPRALH